MLFDYSGLRPKFCFIAPDPREGFPGGSDAKESACNVGDPGSIPGWGKSPGEGNGNPLHILAWEILWTEKPGGLQSMEWQRVGHN